MNHNLEGDLMRQRLFILVIFIGSILVSTLGFSVDQETKNSDAYKKSFINRHLCNVVAGEQEYLRYDSLSRFRRNEYAYNNKSEYFANFSIAVFMEYMLYDAADNLEVDYSELKASIDPKALAQVFKDTVLSFEREYYHLNDEKEFQFEYEIEYINHTYFFETFFETLEQAFDKNEIDLRRGSIDAIYRYVLKLLVENGLEIELTEKLKNDPSEAFWFYRENVATYTLEDLHPKICDDESFHNIQYLSYY